jgi:hypothetical protein
MRPIQTGLISAHVLAFQRNEEESRMSLDFPNISRSFDDKTRRIRFLGHDGMFEVRFFVDSDAITAKMKRVIVGERDFLAAFDILRTQIYATAKKAYQHGKKKDTYVLTAADFS